MLQDPTYPAETLVRLGQLIHDPRHPAERVGREPLEFGPGDTVHELCTETNFTYAQLTHRRFDIGLGATIMSFLPFGIRGQYSASDGKLFEIERVESRLLEPSDSYVQKTLTKPSVREYLAAKYYKKPLYMIVGVKVGRNARILQGRFNLTGGTVSADVPISLSGIPVDPSVDASITTSRFQGVQRQLPDSFVFAYRLREVRYSIKVHLSQLGRTLTRGARLHSFDSSGFMADAEEGLEENGPSEVEFDGLSESDAVTENILGGNVVGGCLLVDSNSSLHSSDDESREARVEDDEECRVFLF